MPKPGPAAPIDFPANNGSSVPILQPGGAPKIMQAPVMPNYGGDQPGGGLVQGLAPGARSFFRRIFPGGPFQGEYGVDASAAVLVPFEAQPVPEPGPKPRPEQTTA